MTELHITTTAGTSMVLDDATVQGFKTSLRGPLLRPGDVGYDEARKVWNGMIDRHPALIARCAGVADVIAAVNFARTHQLLVSVRGGGHNVPGAAVCQGGLMIDLAGMRSVRVDPVHRTARAEGGPPGGTSITRRRPSAWPRLGASSPIPALLASRWAAASAGWRASMA